METQLQKKFLWATPKSIIIISLISFILLTVAIAAQLTYTVLKNQNIYNGVYIHNVHAGGLSKEELASQLKKNFQDKVSDLKLEIRAGEAYEKIAFPELNVTYDIESAVQKAYSIGRSGNIFERLTEILSAGRNGISIPVPVAFDRQKLESKVDRLYTKVQINVKDADLLIRGEQVVLRSGHHGVSFDKSKLLDEIEESIKSCKDGSLEAPLVKTPPSKIDIDTYYNQINLPAKDAQVTVENNTLRIIPHEMGRSLEKSTLASIAAELEKQEDTERILPVVFTKPQVTTEDIHARLFKDTLYTMSTQFYTDNQNNANRGENIKIAVSKINGKILAPGDVFSFNNVVGPRTEEGGYKVAKAYSAGKVIDDVGGGICQVSSTLYNSVLLSDLEVVERTNHMFTVGYVPYGRDAAVAYNSVDFKFRNSTRWPIKIEGWVTKDNRIFFSLKGTNENKDRTIEINSRIVKTMDFQTKYIDDPTLDEGVTSVKTEGMVGYVVDTYKIVKQNGKVVSENKIYTSIYKPLDKEIRRGTKKLEVKPEAKIEEKVEN